MDQRIIDFIAALRAAGVRISVAESADSLRAIEATGIGERDFFRSALRATLIKDAQDITTFDEQFPLFFGTGAPPLPNQPGSGMTDEQREQLRNMLEQMLRNMTPEQLRELFQSMMTGQRMSAQQLQQMLQQLLQAMQQGMQPGQQQGFARSAYMRYMLSRQAMRELEFDRLDDLLQELLERLREAGVSEEELRQLEREAQQNKDALEQQITDQLARAMAQQQGQQPGQPRMEELMERPFEQLDPEDLTDLRGIINRLAARLRSRAALRQRRGNRGQLDAKSTIRANLRFAGVPLDVRHKRKHLKPKLVVICDRSVSTDRAVTFLLLLIYALQDQISRTRSFAFIDTIHDISTYFDEHRPEQAIPQIIHDIQPKRSYSTDLGNSLKVFLQDYAGCVDRRTTVIFLGDARNNNNDPNLAAFSAIRQRARRIVWFNPEPRFMWGRFDPGSLSSDMLDYAPLCDSVHEVRNLRQLVEAIDNLFVAR